MMPLVRLLGFEKVECGCTIGRYRELSTNRVIVYVEEKGAQCDRNDHRLNHTVPPGADASDALRALRSAKFDDDSALTFVFDDSTSPEDVRACLDALADYFRASGGAGLAVSVHRGIFLPERRRLIA